MTADVCLLPSVHTFPRAEDACHAVQSVLFLLCCHGIAHAGASARPISYSIDHIALHLQLNLTETDVVCRPTNRRTRQAQTVIFTAQLPHQLPLRADLVTSSTPPHTDVTLSNGKLVMPHWDQTWREQFHLPSSTVPHLLHLRTLTPLKYPSCSPVLEPRVLNAAVTQNNTSSTFLSIFSVNCLNSCLSSFYVYIYIYIYIYTYIRFGHLKIVPLIQLNSCIEACNWQS